MYLFKVIGDKTQTIFCQHKIIKTFAVIKLRNNNGKLNNENKI